MGLPNENQLVGNGVSYCAVCDGAFFKGKTVGVVGGGNSALQEAVLLSDLCEKVYVLQNLPYLTGEKKLVDILESKDNVEFIPVSFVDEIISRAIVTEKAEESAEWGIENKIITSKSRPSLRP